MAKRNKGKQASSFDLFLSFWTTLPGILTGIAAILTAIGGLYIAFSNHGPISGPTPTPTPSVSPTVIAGGNCLEQNFSGADQIEEGGNRVLQLHNRELKVRFTDSGTPVGALRLRIYPSTADHTLFKIESAVDSQCNEIEAFSNFTRPANEKHTLNNYDKLSVRFGDHNYLLTLEFNGTNVSAAFIRASS
jgi:hypothetical protein